MTKFDWNNPEGMTAGVEVLKKAFCIWLEGRKTKIEAIEEAIRPYRKRVNIPNDDSFVDALTEIINLKAINELKKDGQRRSARTSIINDVLLYFGCCRDEKKEPEESSSDGQICIDEVLHDEGPVEYVDREEAKDTPRKLKYMIEIAIYEY